MEFTYRGYGQLIYSLQESEYKFADYHDYENYPRCVILRHDIDNSIEKSILLAELEAQLGVKST